ncbi:nucleoside deaminase [Naasia lichenicola]|nr:nucleoside deaminase [Naasia lichenicola]
MGLTENDRVHLRATIELARASREHGNHPFGSLLVDGTGAVVARSENVVVTESDLTGHPEIRLAREAAAQRAPEHLALFTLYTSCEPCLMCAGALYWSGIGRIVYALSEETLGATRGGGIEMPAVRLRDVFPPASPVEIDGPALEEEASAPHVDFWV